MPGVELALAMVATVDLCVKYGNKLVQMCASFKAANTEVAERALLIECHWKRTNLQLEFVRRVWQDMDEEHQEINNRIIQTLVSKLTGAMTKIDRLRNRTSESSAATTDSPGFEHTSPTGIKKWKYILLKESLDDTIKGLETWQKVFDPSWFLIMKITNAHIDTKLQTPHENHEVYSSALNLRNTLHASQQGQSSIFLPGDGLKSARIMSIPFATVQVAQRAGSNKWMVLDQMICPPQADVALLTKDIRDLARKFSKVDPMTFGLLNCYGVVKELHSTSQQPTSFTFVFRTPPDLSQPQSLRSLLISGNVDHSLSDRFKVAKDLTRSISYVHNFGFVHKSFRPETILLFQEARNSLGPAYLVGFEKFRTADGRTLRSGDLAWEKNLYRHPNRQGLFPEEDYLMQHDIYSLGVCLLEVGLWQSFVAYDPNGQNPIPASSILGLTPDNSELRNPFKMKDHLVALAESSLPQRMGTIYTKIVKTCLTCLDEDNEDFGNETEFQDEDGILVAVRYIEKVLLQLNSICL